MDKLPRIKLLAIVQNFHENGGGAPESIRLLAQKLSKFVTIDVLCRDGLCSDIAEKSNFPKWQQSPEEEHEIKREKYALGFACGPWISPVIWIKAMFNFNIRRTPIVYLPRGGLSRYEFHNSKRNLLKYLYFYAIEIWIILRCSRIVYSSPLERDTTDVLRSHLFRNFDIIADPVDLGEPTQKRKLQRANCEIKKLGFIAELHPRKSLKEVVDAFKLLDIENEHQFELIIAGEARKSGADYSKRILADLPKNVCYIGRVHPEEKEKFYSEIDALLVPSKFESFSLVCAEAIRHRVPIIFAKNIGFLDGLDADKLKLHIIENVTAQNIYLHIKNFSFKFNEDLFIATARRDAQATEKFLRLIIKLGCDD